MTGSSSCPTCGTAQIPNALFCVKCGGKLAGVPVGPPAAPEAPAWSQPPPAPEPPAWSQPVPPAAAMPPAAPVPPPWSQPVPQAVAAPPAWSQPRAGFQGPPGQPYGVPVQPGAGVARPTGIAILAILEVVGGVLGLVAAKALFDYADLRNYWYGAGSGGAAQFIGLCSAAGAVAAFVLAWGLWSIRPWAWLLGCILSAVSAGFALLSLTGGGDVASAAINIGVDAAVLYYLNTNQIRAIFGHPPSTFMQTGH